MSIYRELDPKSQRRTQLAFNGKREDVAKVSPNQHIQISILILKYPMVQEIMSLCHIPLLFVVEIQAATYKLSDNSLEYDSIFDEPYATTIGEIYEGTTSISYTKVTSSHYQTLSKTDITWKLTSTSCLLVHYKTYCHYFLISLMTLRPKKKKFTTLTSKKL